MKTYMVLATIEGRFCNGMAHRGNLYEINPTVGGPVQADSPEEAIEIYKRKGGKFLSITACDYNEFFNGKVTPANDDDECPF